MNNIPKYKKLQIKHFFRFLKEYDIYEIYIYIIKLYFSFKDDKVVEYDYTYRKYITYNTPIEYICSFPPTDFFKLIRTFRNNNDISDLSYVEILWLYEIRDSKELYFDNIDKDFANRKLNVKLCYR